MQLPALNSSESTADFNGSIKADHNNAATDFSHVLQKTAALKNGRHNDGDENDVIAAEAVPPSAAVEKSLEEAVDSLPVDADLPAAADSLLMPATKTGDSGTNIAEMMQGAITIASSSPGIDLAVAGNGQATDKVPPGLVAAAEVKAMWAGPVAGKPQANWTALSSAVAGGVFSTDDGEVRSPAMQEAAQQVNVAAAVRNIPAGLEGGVKYAVDEPRFSLLQNKAPAGDATPTGRFLAGGGNGHAVDSAGQPVAPPAALDLGFVELIQGAVAAGQDQQAIVAAPAVSVAMEAQLTEFLKGKAIPGKAAYKNEKELTRRQQTNLAHYRLPSAPEAADEMTKSWNKGDSSLSAVSAKGLTPDILFAAAETMPPAITAGSGDDKPTDSWDSLALGADRLMRPLASTSINPGAAGLDAPARTVNENHIVDQVIEWLSVSSHRGTKTLTVRLQPDELGHLKLEMVMDKDGVKANIHTQTQQVQEILAQHIPKIKDALAQLGRKLDDMQVNVDAGGDGTKGFFHERREASADRFFSPSAGREGRGVAFAADTAVVSETRTRRHVRDGLSLRV